MQPKVQLTSKLAHRANISSGIYNSHEKVIIKALQAIESGNKSEVFNYIRYHNFDGIAFDKLPADETCVCRRFADMAKKDMIIKTGEYRKGLPLKANRKLQQVWKITDEYLTKLNEIK